MTTNHERALGVAAEYARRAKHGDPEAEHREREIDALVGYWDVRREALWFMWPADVATRAGVSRSRRRVVRAKEHKA